MTNLKDRMLQMVYHVLLMCHIISSILHKSMKDVAVLTIAHKQAIEVVLKIEELKGSK